MTAVTAAPTSVRAVVGLATVMGLGTWLGFAFGVLAPFLVADLDLQDVQVGALPSVMYLSGALLAAGGGRVVDRVGARTVCLLVPGVVLLANVAFGVASGWAVLVVAAVVGGIALATTNPATNRYVVESLPARARGTAMGWKQAGVSGSSFAVGLLLPSVAEAWGWRAAALGGAAVAAVAAAVLSRLLPRAPSGPTTTDRHVDPATAPRPAVRGTAAYAGLLGAANGALTAYLVLYANRVLDVPATVAGLATAMLGITALGARVGWSTLGVRTGQPVRWLKVISVLAASGFAALALVPVGQTGVLLAVAAVLGVSALSWQALLMVAAVEGVAVGQVGRVSGTVTRAFYGGYVVGPLVVGAAADAGASYRLLWLTAAAVAGAATVVVRRSDRDGDPAGAGVDGRHAG